VGQRRTERWDLAGGRCVESSPAGAAVVSAGADGRFVATSGGYGFQVEDTTTGRRHAPERGVQTELDVTAVATTADGRHALVAYQDWSLHLWEIDLVAGTARFGNRLPRGLSAGERTVAVRTLCGSPAGRFVLAGMADGTLAVWDAPAFFRRLVLRGHAGAVNAVCWSGDGRYALSGGEDHTLRLCRLKSGECRQVLTGHTAPVRAVCLTADRRYALSGGADRTARLWDLATGRCLRTFEGHAAEVTAVAVAADGRLAVSGDGNGVLKVWFLDWELGSDTPPAGP
jgi:WD40 repeat protein